MVHNIAAIHVSGHFYQTFTKKMTNNVNNVLTLDSCAQTDVTQSQDGRDQIGSSEAWIASARGNTTMSRT